jgi:ADP-ribose pyrophosphatase
MTDRTTKRKAANPKPKTLHSTKFLNLVQRGEWVYASRPGVSGVVCIAALTAAREVVLVEQFRPPVQANVIEFPAGLAGDIAGQEHEALVEAARRELLEETGYEPTEIHEVFTGPSSAGLADECITFLVATGVRKVAPGGGDEHESIQVHVVPIERAWSFLKAKIAAGVMVDSRVPSCLYLLEKGL